MSAKRTTMKTTLVIAFTLSSLLGACDPKPSADAMRDAGPPDATTEPDANTTDAATTDANTPDSAAVDAAITLTCPLPRQTPFPEVCNAIDDDCDGLTDEGACNDPCDEAW
jgi:hypothetical protein